MATSSLLVQPSFSTTSTPAGLMDSRPSPERVNVTPPASRLIQLQARFQQRQLQEKEQKLLQMLESQQQRALQSISGRGSAGSSTSSNSSTSSTAGKVRLLFEERRTTMQTSAPRRAPARSGPAATTGWDRSYPLDPLSKSAGTPARRSGVPPPKPRTKQDLDVSLRAVRTTRDTNANQLLSPNDDLPNMFGKLANVGLRNGGANNNYDEEDAPPAPRKPLVRSLQEPKIRPAPAKRTEVVRNPAAAPAGPARTTTITRRPTPPSPARSSAFASPEPAAQKSSTPSSRASPVTAAPSQGPIPPGMAECNLCGRRFNEDRIGKHEEICRKTKSKKRKTFDPVKMRVQGTDVEAYVRKTGKKPGAASSALLAKKPPAANAAKKSDWRKKHEDFIEAIRNAKKVTAHLAAGGKVSDLPPPKPMDTSDYVPCPHCGRKFAEGAAERHIPRCANIKSNKKPAPARAPPARKR